MQSNKHHTIIKLPSIETLGEILQKNEQSLSKNLTKNDEQIAQLQGELSAERDSRKEERFIWIIVSMFFFDCFLFSNVPWGAGLLLFLFEVTVLMIIAKWLGIEYAIKILKPLSNIIDKLIDRTKINS